MSHAGGRNPHFVSIELVVADRPRHVRKCASRSLRWRAKPLAARRSPWCARQPAGARGLAAAAERSPRAPREVGELGDDPVDVGQTVRVVFGAAGGRPRGCVEAWTASFRVGGGGVCAAIDDGVVGMRLATAASARAPNLPRGRALAEALLGEMLEYDMTLTGAVHHMNMVTLDQYGSDDPIEQLVDYTKRALSFLNETTAAAARRRAPSKSPPPPSASSNSFPRPKRSVPKA